MDSKYKSPFDMYGPEESQSSLFSAQDVSGDIGKSLVSQAAKIDPQGFVRGSKGSLHSQTHSMEDIEDKTVGSQKSLYSHMGSGLSVHSAGSSVSMHSQGSGLDRHQQELMSSTQYLAVSQQMGSGASASFMPQNVSTAAARPQSLPGITPLNPGNLTHQGAMTGTTTAEKPKTSDFTMPPDDVSFYQRQIALQRAHAQQQHKLHVSQLLQQLEILSVEEKRGIFISLQRSTPSLLTRSEAEALEPSTRPKSKSDSDVNPKKSEAILPLFFTGAAGSTQKLDEEHLNSLEKTFGEKFTENILPIPILLPTVVNPWVYKSYQVSLVDLVKMNKYMYRKGRQECAEANIGQMIIEAINSSRDSLKASQGGLSSKSRSNVGSSKGTTSREDPVKAAFESTQSLPTDNVGAVSHAAKVHGQMGINMPPPPNPDASTSCWSGTAAGPHSSHGAGSSGTSLHHSTQFVVDTESANLKFTKVELQDICDNVESLCGKKKKGKCTIS